MNLNTNAVGPDFARTTGIRVIAGRDLTWSDLEGKRRVAVVTEEMARYFFDDVNVVGRRYSAGNTYDPSADYEIVGVVTNAKYSQVRGDFPRTAYVPFNANRASLRGLYSALALACVGLYGTISFGVGRRRSEIAVRMALGARYAQVLWMILRQALLLAIVGVVVGIPLSLLASQYVSSLLFGLTPRDPGTLALTAAMLIGVASLAGYLPARRAALVDPARALKQD